MFRHVHPIFRLSKEKVSIALDKGLSCCFAPPSSSRLDRYLSEVGHKAWIAKTITSLRGAAGEVEQQIAGLRGEPGDGRRGGHTEYMDPAARAITGYQQTQPAARSDPGSTEPVEPTGTWLNFPRFAGGFRTWSDRSDQEGKSSWQPPQIPRSAARTSRAAASGLCPQAGDPAAGRAVGRPSAGVPKLDPLGRGRPRAAR